MRLPENILWALWESSEVKDEIILDNDNLKIISRGKYTGDTGGPDYSEVSIIFNETRYTGSLEIDADQSGWVSHGHAQDPAFNSCILHIYGGKAGSETLEVISGRSLPSVPLAAILKKDLQTSLAALLQKGKLPSSSPLICSGKLLSLDTEFVKKYLYELSIQRFQKKCKRFSDLYYNCGQNLNQLYSLDPDAEFVWKYTISAMIFRAMGYSANTSLMEDLFSLVNPAFLIEYSGRENFADYLETYIWELSGLLPTLSELEDDESIRYIRKIKERWEEIRKYLHAAGISKHQWKTRGLRPNATVYIRIYSAVQIVSALWNQGFSDIFHQRNKSLTKNDFNKLLSRHLQFSAGEFWGRHSSFTKVLPNPVKTLPGASRVQEILINVFLPGLYAYFTLTENNLMKENCKNAFLEMKVMKNPGSISKILHELLPSDKSEMAVYYQGAVELSAEYCKMGRCDECKIGERVF